MDDRKCYRKFKQIIKENGNDNTYLEWRDWVELELENSDGKEILNLLKYYEINYQIAERNKGARLLDISVLLISVFMNVFGMFASILMVEGNNLAIILNQFEELISWEAYTEMFEELIMSMVQTASNLGCKMIVVAISTLLIAHSVEYCFQKCAAQKCAYYLEVVNILQEIKKRKIKSVKEKRRKLCRKATL